MSYDLTIVNQTSARTFLDSIVIVNNASGQVFGTLLLITIMLGYYFLFSKEQKIDDFLTSSFITSVIATLMMFASIITWQIYIAFLFIFIATFILKWYMT
jgi:asparagine N-glycosylation enzyme membrane subunit Stt3